MAWRSASSKRQLAQPRPQRDPRVMGGSGSPTPQDRPFLRVGLTGSIAMGKSTVAEMFKGLGAATFDADAAVHRLYAAGGAAGPVLRMVAPDAVTANGAVDRGALKAAIASDPDLLKKVEGAVHPLLVAERHAFEAQARESGATVLVFDIPLLFETGLNAEMDQTVVVSAPADVQRARALARPDMTPAHLEAILARQMPDDEKRARADVVISTEGAMTATKDQVRRAMAKFEARLKTMK